MKSTIRIAYLAMSAAIIAGLASCNGNEKVRSHYGELISFTAGSNASAVSKTAYSGSVTSDGERIDWTYNDVIRIYCEQASDPPLKRADYAIDAGSISGSGAVSEAKIEHTRRIGLHWGDIDKAHIFYAVCPSPIDDDDIGDVLGNGSLRGHIPAVQAVNSTSAESGNIKAKPDMSSMYLVAHRTLAAGVQDVGDVFLSFTPITTAIEFSIQNAYSSGNDMCISALTLTSESKSLSGVFTSDLAGWSGDYPTCAAAGDNGSSVSIEFATPVVVPFGKTLDFTMFMLPVSDVDDLTFKITKPDGTWLSLKLSYETGTGISFARCKKSYVSGILVPEGVEWTVNYSDPWLVSWDNGINSNVPLKKED